MIEIIKQFVLDNWQLIVAAVVFIISFILQLIKKKPISDIVSHLYDIVCTCVIIAENTPLKGVAKRDYCLELVKDRIEAIFPGIDFSRYLDMCIFLIERVLMTPQKKTGVYQFED